MSALGTPRDGANHAARDQAGRPDSGKSVKGEPNPRQTVAAASLTDNRIPESAKPAAGTTGVKPDFVLRMPRVLSNACEAAFQRLAYRAGWNSTKTGWPDFLCFGPSGELICVEVKPRSKLTGRLGLLDRDQAMVMDALQAAGIRCYVSDGVTLEPYTHAKHAPPQRRRNGSEDADVPTPQARRDFSLQRAIRRGRAKKQAASEGARVTHG